MTKTTLLLSISLLALSACDTFYDKTPRPDNTIKVMPTAQGTKAIPPECASFATATMNPYDQQPLPQFGCASARNLALMVEQPDDVVHGREMDGGRAVASVGAVKRYDNNQTRALIYPTKDIDTVVDTTTMSSSTSAITGDSAGGGGGASSSSSSSAGSAAAAP
ncbi:MAG TPA: CpaD family pilus assembly lipoprotein [Alphaproteobacteria bacterium]|nr:CpaD family pilus assembly lipoprotein [Alphaproteobacteria bacterium]